MENNKKIIVPTIIAVATLVLLIFGATYAYFTIGSTNNFGTKELNATVEGMADAVVLEQVESTLSLDVTRAMMSEDNKYTTYYASGSSIPANIAKMSVAGEGRYACDYTISVTKSASSEENDLYTALRNYGNTNLGVAYLSINGNSYNFYQKNLFPITYSGTTYGITKDAPKYITANMSIINSNSNQNFLKGKDVTLTFEVTEFDCYLNEADESAPIYAIYDENEQILAFYQNHDDVNVGDSYDGYTVTGVYKNLNNTNFASMEDIPWPINEDYTHTLVIEEPIKPKNTAWWFCFYDVDKLYNLDTSEVTNMSHMFDHFFGTADVSSFDTSNVEDMSYMFNDAASEEISGLETFNTSKVKNMSGMLYGNGFYGDRGLSNWDTSNVTNMSHMFASIYIEDVDLDLSTWDTSKVTNMSGMFEGAFMNNINLAISTWDTSNVTDMSSMFEGAETVIADLSNWDTSNVTDMSSMFKKAAPYGQFNVGNITRREVTANGKTYIAWDTSKVTNMESMFDSIYYYEQGLSLNLTSWQVPLVTNYTNFNKGVEDEITPPTWVN